MAKMKTRKAAVKRFKVTSGKKLLRRRSRQNHFNARQDGNQKRAKRIDVLVPKKETKNILTVI